MSACSLALRAEFEESLGALDILEITRPRDEEVELTGAVAGPTAPQEALLGTRGGALSDMAAVSEPSAPREALEVLRLRVVSSDAGAEPFRLVPSSIMAAQL